MAWRDSRRNRTKLMLFIASIVVGIAALVAINSFGDNLQKDINLESKTLLAADLLVEGHEKATDSLELVFDTLNALERASSMNFLTFVTFPKHNDFRLTLVKAVEGNYPFYGELETTPLAAAQTYKNGKSALVENLLMVQFGVAIGDSLRIGAATFEIVGQIESVPGRSAIAGTFAPLVYIPKAYVPDTKLLDFGVRTFYQYYFKFDESTDVETLAETSLKPALDGLDLNYETVESRKNTFGEIFGVIGTFLNLVAFIALLLGCIGVASSVHIYIKDKLPTVAVLRCLGTSGRQAFFIFLIQVAVMGLLGALLGGIIGSALQKILPFLFEDFLPVKQVSTDISWSAIGQGILTGLTIAILFALLPLLRIRKVSPLRSLRASYDKDINERDPWRWLVYFLIAAFIVGFTMWQVGVAWETLYFPLAIGVGLAMLAGMAALLKWAVKKFFPVQWSYVWRQGIANLYRPNNQTLLLLVSVGLGTGLISNMFFVRELLLQQVEKTTNGNQPNILLFDIQQAQVAEVKAVMDSFDMPLMRYVPITTLELATINADSVARLAQDGTDALETNSLLQDYQVTYRDTLMENEKIISGKWHTKQPKDGNIYVSVQEQLAEELQLEVGDSIGFFGNDRDIRTVVGSIREHKEEALQPNFSFVFPEGALDSFPQMNIMLTQADSVQQSVNFQQALIWKVPNATVVDFGQVLKTLDSVLEKISFVIRFMALFSILTGIIVLISSVVLTKYQRVKESVLLRTLGASRRQILWINAIEYIMLGSLAALTGMLLSILGSYLLAHFAFDLSFRPNWLPPILWFLGITLLTLVIGLFNTREVLFKPPLEVLRNEV